MCHMPNFQDEFYGKIIVSIRHHQEASKCLQVHPGGCYLLYSLRMSLNAFWSLLVILYANHKLIL